MADFPTTYAKRTLLISLVSVGMGFTVIFPLLAPLGREMGLTEFQITSVIGASAIVVFLCSPIWGRQSDRWGRKPVLLTGLFGIGAGTLLFCFVLQTGLSGLLIGIPLFITLVIARMLHAVMMAACMPAANAYMADITEPQNRAKGMGQAGAANNLGAMIGPAIAALAFISLLTPLWVMAAIAFLNGLFVWRFLPEPPRIQVVEHPPRMKYTDARILPFIVVGVTMFTGMALVQQTMGFRFQDALGLDAAATAQQFGLAMMLSAGCSLFAQAMIVQRLNLTPFLLLRLALPLLIVAFLMMALFETRLALTVAMMIQGFGMGLAGPAFMAGASLAVTPEEQGAVAGVAGSCPPLGFAVGPMIGGALYQFGAFVPYAFAASIYVLLFLSMGLLRRYAAEQGNARNP